MSPHKHRWSRTLGSVERSFYLRKFTERPHLLSRPGHRVSSPNLVKEGHFQLKQCVCFLGRHFSIINSYVKLPGDLIKNQGLIQEVWGETWKPTFLRSPHKCWCYWFLDHSLEGQGSRRWPSVRNRCHLMQKWLPTGWRRDVVLQKRA